MCGCKNKSYNMKNKVIILLAILLTTACQSSQLKETSHERETLFNKDWQFVKDVSFKEAINDSSLEWEQVSLPHTAQIEPVVMAEAQWQGDAYYRKIFTPSSELKNKHVALHFEGAMQVAEIYLNGEHLMTNYSGYLPFYVDLTGRLKLGEGNEILVKLNNEDNPQVPPGKALDQLDFNIFSGIYRNVWFVVKNELHISDAIGANRVAAGGIMVTYSEVSEESATLHVQVDAENISGDAANAAIKVSIRDQAGELVAEKQTEVSKLDAKSHQLFNLNFNIGAPKLWSPGSPHLYSVNVELLKDEKLCDFTSERIGIKTFTFHNKGFELNGEPLYIRGTNRHQEYPYIGYALSDNANYRDAYKIREAGFNFVRSSHYPHSKSFLEACDELGLMVMDAIPGWQFFGDSVFAERSIMDVRKMVRRDRNHASIILWEAALNETQMPKEFIHKAHNAVKEEYLSMDVFTCGWVEEAYDVYIPARQHGKPPHYWNQYERKPILIAEYGDWEYYAHNAGFNQTAFSDLTSDERNSRQLRGMGQKRLAQQALNYQEAHNSNRKGGPAVDANWLMYDYSRGYAPDLEASGISDIFRIPKFAFYFYKSQAAIGEFSQAEFNEPFIFIANYYNDPTFREVKLYSNCDEVELLVNGESLGRRKPDTDIYSTHLAKAPFTFSLDKVVSGTITANGYVDGELVTTSSRPTPGEATSIKLWIDESGRSLEAGNGDMVFLYAAIVDQNGTILPEDSSEVRFSIKGDAQLIGANPVKAEAGISTIILKAGNDYALTIEASADNITSGSLSINLK